MKLIEAKSVDVCGECDFLKNTGCEFLFGKFDSRSKPHRECPLPDFTGQVLAEYELAEIIHSSQNVEGNNFLSYSFARDVEKAVLKKIVRGM